MQGSFRVGEWLVQPEAGRVTRHGHTVYLRAKVMDLLVCLAARPGQVISKDVLLQTVWGTDALSESALTRSMTELRQSLDDDAERPTVIETIPKRGYRVIAPVAEVTGKIESALEAGVEDRATPPIPSHDISRHRVAWALPALVAGILLGALGAGVFNRGNAAPDPRPVRFLLSPPEGTTFGAFATDPQPAVSPDGRQIATVATSKDATRRIWIHTLDTLSARALAGTEGASFPFWSPDGRWVAFFADGKLKRSRSSGGTSESICDAPDGFGGTWSRRGVVLFAANGKDGIYGVPADGGAPHAVTYLDAAGEETSHRFPHFLPDGDHYIFLVRANRAEHRGIFLGSLASGSRKRLTGADSNVIFAEPGHLLFVRDGALLAQPFDPRRLELVPEPVLVAPDVIPAPTVRSAPFSASGGVLAYRPGGILKTQLAWTNRAGKSEGTVGEAARYLTAAISPHGDRLAVDLLELPGGTINTWLFDLSRKVSYPFTFGPSTHGSPVWSPDGARIITASSGDGTWSLSERNVNVRPPDSAANVTSRGALLVSQTEIYPQDISSDGGTILYVERTQVTGFDVWSLPKSGAQKPHPVLQSPFNETHPQLSPDSRWLAYTSDESGRLEVYVRPFNSSGGKWRVSTDGGCQPRWRVDGKELFYLNRQGLMAVSIAADSTFRPGLPVKLFDTRAGRTSGVMWDYAAARDGQRFLFKELVFDESGSPMVVVLDWQALR